MDKTPIFVYHHISNLIEPSLKYMYVSPDRFEQQMHFLYRKGFRCLSLSEAVANWLRGEPQPQRSFVVTFDAGYVDNLENAAPVLKKFGFTATIFIPVKEVMEGDKRYLSWRQMRELACDQFIFGSHTLTHPKLPGMDRNTIMRELKDSKKIIEDQLGQPVKFLAYPYGESDESIQAMAYEVGYLAACGVDRGKLNLFNLWRVPVRKRDSRLTFYWKANGGYYQYTSLRRHKLIDEKIRTLKRTVARLVKK